MSANEPIPSDGEAPNRPESGRPDAALIDAALIDSRTARALLFALVVVAVLVALWALTEGGERDLWSSPNSLDAALRWNPMGAVAR